MSFDAVLFDMDGVLVDSEPLHAVAWQQVLDEAGLEAEIDFLRDWVGIPDETLARHLVEAQGLALPEGEALARKRDLYRRRMAQEKPCPDGVREGLETLRRRLARTAGGPAPMAVASSSPTEELPLILDAVSLRGFFDVLVGAQDVARHKPEPDPYLLAAERLGVDPHGCAVVEDSVAGVRSGRAAGCTVLAVTSTYDRETLSEAHHVFGQTREAIDWILARLG